MLESRHDRPYDARRQVPWQQAENQTMKRLDIESKDYLGSEEAIQVTAVR